MKRPILILAVAAVLGITLLAGSYLTAQRWCSRQLASSADELDWLRQEFRLSDAELARVRELHDGYMPKCMEMCQRIAAKKSELEAVLAGTTTLTPAAEVKLQELGALRAECQTHMLRHFAEVSQAMPPEQGRRYLAEMQRLTLGFHEHLEQSMSKSADHDHGHH
jgi:hypothetical protein